MPEDCQMEDSTKKYKLILGDCLIKLKDIEDNSIDSVVTDSPYGISFMGKNWDYDVPSVDIWKECLRVLKPGGHLLSFSGSRTYHRMAVNIEDAGFEIRDQIMWVYGSGFPKSLNVGKAIDKKLGCEREKIKIDSKQVRNPKATGGGTDGTKGATRPWIEKALENGYHEIDSQNPISEEAKQYDGWGTALKPAHEPIVLARKPFKGDVTSNVLKYGTGALNIDACRVGEEEIKTCAKKKGESFSSLEPEKGFTLGCDESFHNGRWPANFIHDGLEEEWSKYFYCPKANKKDRNEGCEDLEEKPAGCMVGNNELARPNHKGLNDGKFVTAKNNHPTVKPTELMRYLIKLVTPKNGTVLDPFMGSGSTGKACMLEKFNFIGIELSEEYLKIAIKRIDHALNNNKNIITLKL